MLNKGGEVIGTVGSKVQKTLDESGVTQNVTYYAGTAMQGTVTIGSKILEKGTEKFEQVRENPVVNDLAQKSKQTIGAGVTAFTGATTVSHLIISSILCVVCVQEVQNYDSAR